MKEEKERGIEKKCKEYYKKHMKEEMERLNKLVDWHKCKLKEINEASADSRPKMLGKQYRCSQKNKNLGVMITRLGTLNPINYPKYPPELEYPRYEANEESCEIYYDSPTITTLPAGYKPYSYGLYQYLSTLIHGLDVLRIYNGPLFIL